MKNFTSVMLLLTICMCSCASRYKTINPQGLSYNSVDLIDGISLEYKYNVLQKKYRKKEDKKKVKLVAVKIINNSERDITLGQDLQITYNSGTPVQVLDNKSVYKSLKQSVVTLTLLFYKHNLVGIKI